MGRYIAFDVETPNYRNDRMSAIGLVVVEDGALREEYYTLVNPEERFDAFNIQLTGITPAMVRRSPTFPEVWERLRPVMETGTLLAHNAPFDLGVLSKCLRDYGISWRRSVPYACTCVMGRALLPELENHRLNTMCAALGIELDHHNAASDTRACARLLLHYQAMGAPLDRFSRWFDLSACRTVREPEEG